MSNLQTSKPNTDITGSYGFKLPTDPNKAATIEALLMEVHSNTPSQVDILHIERTSQTLNKYSSIVKKYAFEASLCFTSNYNSLFLTFNGALTADDETRDIKIDSINDNFISVFQSGSLTTPLNLFSDAQYTPDEIRNVFNLILNKHVDVFKAELQRSISKHP